VINPPLCLTRKDIKCPVSGNFIFFNFILCGAKNNLSATGTITSNTITSDIIRNNNAAVATEPVVGSSMPSVKARLREMSGIMESNVWKLKMKKMNGR
jgi:hypothetical protein